MTGQLVGAIETATVAVRLLESMTRDNYLPQDLEIKVVVQATLAWAATVIAALPHDTYATEAAVLLRRATTQSERTTT